MPAAEPQCPGPAVLHAAMSTPCLTARTAPVISTAAARAQPDRTRRHRPRPARRGERSEAGPGGRPAPSSGMPGCLRAWQERRGAESRSGLLPVPAPPSRSPARRALPAPAQPRTRGAGEAGEERGPVSRAGSRRSQAVR